MTCIATICARGGSVGVPRKNVLPLLGKPLIVYTIEQALESKGIDAVYVSTDSDEIAEVARRAGARVPFLRPARLATADAPKIPVIEHMVAGIEREDVCIDVIVDLQPTSPLRAVGDIEACLALLDAETDVVITGYESDKNPYFNMVEYGDDEPLFTALFAFTVGERATRLQWSGLLLGFAGIALVLCSDRLTLAGVGPLALTANLIALAGITVGTLYQKKHGGGADLPHRQPDPVRGLVRRHAARRAHARVDAGRLHAPVLGRAGVVGAGAVDRGDHPAARYDSPREGHRGREPDVPDAAHDSRVRLTDLRRAARGAGVDGSDRGAANGRFSVQYADYSEQFLKEARSADEVLKKASTVDAFNIGGKVVNEKDLPLGRYPGRELQVENAELAMRIRLYLVDRRMYKVVAAWPKSRTFSLDDERFLNSFRLAP